MLGLQRARCPARDNPLASRVNTVDDFRSIRLAAPHMVGVHPPNPDGPEPDRKLIYRDKTADIGSLHE